MRTLQTAWKRKDPITAGWLAQVSLWLSNFVSFNAWLQFAYQAQRIVFKVCPQIKYSIVVDSNDVLSLKNDEAAPATYSFYGVPQGASEPQWVTFTKRSVVVDVKLDGTDIKQVKEDVYVYQPSGTQTESVVVSLTNCPP